MIMYARLWGVDRDRECYFLLIRGQGQNNKGFSLSFVPLSHLILTTRSLRTVLEGVGPACPAKAKCRKGKSIGRFLLAFHVLPY